MADKDSDLSLDCVAVRVWIRVGVGINLALVVTYPLKDMDGSSENEYSERVTFVLTVAEKVLDVDTMPKECETENEVERETEAVSESTLDDCSAEFDIVSLALEMKSLRVSVDERRSEYVGCDLDRRIILDTEADGVSFDKDCVRESDDDSSSDLVTVLLATEPECSWEEEKDAERDIEASEESATFDIRSEAVAWVSVLDCSLLAEREMDEEDENESLRSRESDKECSTDEELDILARDVDGVTSCE